MISEDDLKEFRQEGAELLEAAEKALLSLELGSDYKTQYNAIFRAFHNLKGAAGMMEMLDLQSHTHILETELVSQKEKDSLTSSQIDYFLKGVDTAKKLLWGLEQKTEPVENVVQLVPATPQYIPEPKLENTEQPVLEKSVHVMVEPTRILMFSQGDELNALESSFKALNFEVHNHSDYIDGITKYDELKPHVIFVSPQFTQTSLEELKSILKNNWQNQLFIDFNFTNLNAEFLINYIRSHFENINLKMLVDEATDLLKFHYPDLVEYLRSRDKQHLEKSLTSSIRELFKHKSTVTRRYKNAS